MFCYPWKPRLVLWTSNFHEVHLSQELVRWMVNAPKEKLLSFAATKRMEKVKENDSVIVMTHAPNWILDSYGNEVTGKNVSYLIRDHLNGKCKLRIARDLHHYMRHSFIQSEKPTMVQHLLVNGCGGAFLNPTHVFTNLIEAHETKYEMIAAYLSVQDSSKIAMGNILKFRKKNWQFDFIGGLIYFILIFSMVPLCKVDHILRDDTFSGRIQNFFSAVWDALMDMVITRYTNGIVQLKGSIESEHFRDPKGLRGRIEQWTFGLYPACIKYLMSTFDVPEVMAVTRTNICKSGMISMSRGVLVVYYVSVFFLTFGCFQFRWCHLFSVAICIYV